MEDGDSDSSLDSIEKDELNRKMKNMARIIQTWKAKEGAYKKEVRRLLTIDGNYHNCNSIFTRLGISPDINLDQVLEDNYDGPEILGTQNQQTEMDNLTSSLSICIS